MSVVILVVRVVVVSGYFPTEVIVTGSNNVIH